MQEFEIPIIKLWSRKSLVHFGGYPRDVFNRAARGRPRSLHLYPLADHSGCDQ